MKDFFNKLKIPTLLGLAIITSGIAAGVFLTLREQNFLSKASPDVTPQNITISNITDDSVTISWQTSISSPSFITFGQSNPQGQTILDDRDNSSPQSHLVHYSTIKNLLPQTIYQYKIISGKIKSETGKFTTAIPADQIAFSPIIGNVLANNKPLDEGIAYLSIADAAVESSLIKNSGNFIIPISQIRKTDLSGIFPLTGDTVAKLTIISGDQQSNVLFKIKDAKVSLPVINLGEDLDLTASPSAAPSPEGNKYDLNSDGKINAADSSIVVQNFGPLREAGKNPKNPKADLNGDGVVDQKDLDLMSKQINQ